MFDYATTAHNNKKQQQIKLQQKIRSTLNDCSSASCCRRFCQRNELNLSYGYIQNVCLYIKMTRMLHDIQVCSRIDVSKRKH